MYLLNEFNFFSLTILFLLWIVGGYFVLKNLFDLPDNELPLLGLGFGLVFGTWATNLLARFVPGVWGFWLAPTLLVAFGFFLSMRNQTGFTSPSKIPYGQITLFITAAVTFTLIGRGFGFFDDHQNLPPLSNMAAGDIPPHFAFNPSLMFGYHYFLLLTGAGFVRLAGAGPWSALDLARGITLALTVFYAGFLAWRITRNRFIQAGSMLFVLFAGGARWIMLLLPASLLRRISSSITLIGSGADSGPNFVTALLKNWNIEGQGPFPLPFMYGSGLDPSFSMFHNGWGTSAVMMVLLALLLAKHKKPGLVSALPFIVLFSSVALANEVTFSFFYAGFVLSALAIVIQKKDVRALLRDKEFLWWFAALVAAGVVALVQGGMLTEIFFGLFKPKVADAQDTYFRVSFALGLPAFLSSHLGTLSLANPFHWLPILGETGLAILALPLVAKQLSKALREQDWISSAWIMSLFVSLAMVFFSYTGNAGPTAISRMQAHFLTVIKLYAIPLVWLWVKERGENWKMATLGWAAVTVLSGFSLFGFQITAMANPVYAIFLGPLDGQMFERQWNKLEPGSMVFDPVYPRAATVLGRPIRSSITMGETLPEWKALFKNPDPAQMHLAGYHYLYTDKKYRDKFTKLINQDCVIILDQVENVENGAPTDGRYLYDISACN